MTLNDIEWQTLRLMAAGFALNGNFLPWSLVAALVRPAIQGWHSQPIVILCHCVPFFAILRRLPLTDPLRFARPPNFGGQYFLPLYSSPNSGRCPLGRWGLSPFVALPNLPKFLKLPNLPFATSCIIPRLSTQFIILYSLFKYLINKTIIINAVESVSKFFSKKYITTTLSVAVRLTA